MFRLRPFCISAALSLCTWASIKPCLALSPLLRTDSCLRLARSPHSSSVLSRSVSASLHGSVASRIVTGHTVSAPTRRGDVSLNAMGQPDVNLLADALGYLLGGGSLLLYTPIAVRVIRQGKADGLTISTWWLKLASYTCSNLYAYTNGYPLSTYIETLIITAEATVILFLVAYFQRKINAQFVGLAAFYAFVSAWALTEASPEVVALGQVGSAALNAGALVPQFVLNAESRTKGDYSPVTAGLASAGCLARLYTTTQLADSDPILLGSFGIALLFNSALLAQILYYGVAVEGLSPVAVLTSDLGSAQDENTSD